MTTGTRAQLAAGLAAWRLALGGYLGRLLVAWEGRPQHSSELARVLDGVGPAPAADRPERDGFAAAADAVHSGDGALGALHDRLGLGTGELLTVAAVWWAETDPQFAVAFGCAHDDGARRYASAALLRLLLDPYEVPVPPSWDATDPLVRLGLLEGTSGPDGPLRLTPTARRLIADLPTGDRPEPAALPDRHIDLRGRLAARLRNDPGGAVLLRGPRGSGLRAVAAAAVRAAGLTPVTDPRPAAELRLLARLRAGVPIVPADQLPELAWTPQDGPLLAYGLPGDPACGAHPIDVPAPTPPQRAAHWRRELAAAGLDDAETAGRLGARFPLGEEDIADAVARARSEATWAGEPLTTTAIWEAARHRPEHELHRVAVPVIPAFTLDDLVLPADVRAQLDELIAHVALQDVVLDGWGFRRRMPRGQGVAVLFSGPPGTGKTMAAEALAAALDQDLYRIDLSAVVSKYIGETEKNLALAFEEAERAAAVLFFDECDALFGKRTEQHDAHDRWANLEVNYLLQRVETFTGLVVLATNKRAALDEAFLRRLRFTIRFEMPDLTLRRELWRRAFPAPVPREELDWDVLAGRELAGGNVQASALAAAFLAAADGGRVRAAHVAHALRREYDKLGKAWTEGHTGG